MHTIVKPLQPAPTQPDRAGGLHETMHDHIDWLSFTFFYEDRPLEHFDLQFLAQGLINEHKIKGLGEDIFDGQLFSPCKSRAPYRLAIQRQDHGARIFAGSHTNTVLFELTGVGCSNLCNSETTLSDVFNISECVTRFDIAVDMRTTTKPVDFLGDADDGRFRSRSTVTSDSGQTVYRGSPKSDRFLRVYRYSPPHPRADLLRCEFVFRRSMAKAACRDYTTPQQARSFVARCGNTYGFNHADWQPEVITQEKVAAPKLTTPSNDASVFWVYNQVIPALKRLHREGALMYSDFLKELFS